MESRPTERVARPRLAFLAALATLVSAAWPFAPVSAQSESSAYTTGYRYDAFRRLVGQIDPDPDRDGPLPFSATRYTYDPDGQITKVEKGILANWQPDTVIPAGWTGFTPIQTTDLLYDSNGNKVSKTVTADGMVRSFVQYKFDAVGRLECTATRMNSAVYSSAPGACVPGDPSATYGTDRISRNVYDLAGRMTQIRRATGVPGVEQAYVTYSYTPNGKIDFLIDANGNRAQYKYDGFDRQSCWILPSTTLPDSYNPATQATALATAGFVSGDCVTGGLYEKYDYDENNNKTIHRRRDGRTIEYTYDALDRVTVKHFPTAPAEDVHSGYDMRDLRIYARFGSPTGLGVTNNYDGAGRLAWSSDNSDGTARRIDYGYDRNGNRTGITHPDSVGFVYDYDDLGRVTAIRAGGTAIATIVYANSGDRDSITRPGENLTSYQFTGDGRLTTLGLNLEGAGQDQTFTYEYNPARQIRALTGSNQAYSSNSAYDVNRPYTRNGLNQYKEAGPADFEYDPNGNLVTDGSTTFDYDVENRLTSATGVKTANLKYNPLGRLRETSGGPQGVTRFLYDRDDLVAEYDGAGNLIRRYVHGPDSDEPLIWYEGAGTADAQRRNLYANHQGSVIAVTGSSGAVIAVNGYDSWGIPNHGNLGRFQYTGQATIPELEVYHYKSRVYSPTLGRFLQVDTVGYEDQINLYTYAGNDPVNGWDPDGTSCASPDPTVCQPPAPIHGNAQSPRGPHGPRHAAESQRIAEKAARVKGVVSVHLNRPLSAITGGAIKSGVRPDVTVVMSDGRVIPIEVPSPKQTRAFLAAKYSGISGGGRFGRFTLKPPIITPAFQVPAAATMSSVSSRVGRLLNIFGIFSTILGIAAEEKQMEEEAAYCAINGDVDTRCMGPVA